MNIKRMISALLILFFANYIGAHEKDDLSKFATKQLIIDGLVKNKLTLSVNDLRNRKMTTIEDVPMRCSETRVKSESDSYTGVLLRDLLEEAEVDITNHREKNTLYLVASASDDWHVLFSWHELMNTKVGERILVFLDSNGKAIGAEEGHIALISAADDFTCSRHVKWLKSISIQRASLTN